MTDSETLDRFAASIGTDLERRLLNALEAAEGEAIWFKGLARFTLELAQSGERQ